MQISAYTAGDEKIWIPVSKPTGAKGPRAFLPTRGLGGKYRYGYKADRRDGEYLEALTVIQTAFINNESKIFRLDSGKEERQYRAKWRHGQENSASGLTPGGWVQILFNTLTTVTETEIAEVLAASASTIAAYTSSATPSIENTIPGETSTTTDSATPDSTITEYTPNANPGVPLFVPVLTEARTFQLKFRANALLIWKPSCAISGATVALEAAHIKPVAASKLQTDEVIDCYNSIILNAGLHRLFDQGLFSFSSEGKLIISPLLSKKNQEVFGLNKEVTISFHPKAKGYLDFHRTEVHRMDV